MRSLSVVVPARDEEAAVGGVVRAALAELDARALDGEVIVVDDGSRDRTGPVVEAMAAVDRRVRLVHHPRSLGYGAALRAGFAAARGEHLCFTDADRQFDLADLGRLLPFVDDFDLVVGYRAVRRDPLGRRVAARAWNALVRAVLGVGVRDVDCAFKVLHHRVLRELPLRSRGAFVNSELLARARARGFRVYEVPVRHFPRVAGRPSGGRPAVIGRALVELARFAREPGRA